MFPTTPQGALWPPTLWGPPNYGWSQELDYGGGSLPLYILWAPVGSNGVNNGVGYIQRLTYSGSAVTSVQWAVCAYGTQANPTAKWADRATLLYA